MAMNETKLLILLLLLKEFNCEKSEIVLKSLVEAFLPKTDAIFFEDEIKDLAGKKFVEKLKGGFLGITEKGVNALRKDTLISLAREAKLD